MIDSSYLMIFILSAPLSDIEMESMPDTGVEQNKENIADSANTPELNFRANGR